MIMSAVHDPLGRKRPFEDENGPESKKSKSESESATSTMFSDKMYSAFVKSAFESLDKVCSLFFIDL